MSDQPLTPTAERRRRYEHLTSRQCWEIRRRIVAAENECDVDYMPLSRAVFSLASHYGVSPGTIVKVIDDMPDSR
ncbi:hypothetical protein MYRNA_179 [Mycobacterium phage Myrna]|uniref:Uncharacterized protein n=1 Tax=Mycobacterium phage Myrna TaxID=546805 RepID=B5LJF1_9CAUD|nr:gp179 [Mycobacterium phage Myrna]ACH62148.1 hypothetical protein MYRNA_179 [Mycobacterium phage Myrna]